ncbi:MAG: helix-turn-helix domain-containing GNAT family N-acetyltransferase [Eubacteriales bacterium]|nr:helix-turn-helix domain-containing GNAT family N-acetyltransferase [Eubacteriales bacterium]
MDARLTAVGHIRSFNRFYTRILGLLNKHILDSDFSPTEARVLLEISMHPDDRARELSQRLAVDASYLSRMLKSFETKGLITRTPCAQDNRLNEIHLTEKGEQTLAELGRRSDAQVLSLVEALPDAELNSVLHAMNLIREQFSHAAFPAVIRGYRKGDEDYMIRRHRELYLKEYGLSAVFAEYVDRTVHELTDHLDPVKECVLIPEIDGQPMGSIAIAKRDGQTAQLRYFLLDPEARGHGLGLRLIEAALDFCRKAGYQRVFLETISLLTTARSLYSRMGFRIYQSRVQSDWGREVVEEYWELML